MKTTLQKWGNSYAIRIPKNLVTSLDWTEGSVVGFEQTGDKILISSNRPKYSIKDMVKGMKKGNQHEYIDFGEPKGKEIW